MRMRSRGLLAPSDLKSGQYLNQSMKQMLPVLLPQAWQILQENFPGLLVRMPDVRGTHWEMRSCDQRRSEMCLTLQYVHDPLSIKCWRLYPRRLSCLIKLRAKGVATIAEITYSAGSAMDYQTVYAIIDQTNSSIGAAMEQLRIGQTYCLGGLEMQHGAELPDLLSVRDFGQVAEMKLPQGFGLV